MGAPWRPHLHHAMWPCRMKTTFVRQGLCDVHLCAALDSIQDTVKSSTSTWKPFGVSSILSTVHPAKCWENMRGFWPLGSWCHTGFCLKRALVPWRKAGQSRTFWSTWNLGMEQKMLPTSLRKDLRHATEVWKWWICHIVNSLCHYSILFVYSRQIRCHYPPEALEGFHFNVSSWHYANSSRAPSGSGTWRSLPMFFFQGHHSGTKTQAGQIHYSFQSWSVA